MSLEHQQPTVENSGRLKKLDNWTKTAAVSYFIGFFVDIYLNETALILPESCDVSCIRFL